jgi:hypothetical protein
MIFVVGMEHTHLIVVLVHQIDECFRKHIEQESGGLMASSSASPNAPIWRWPQTKPDHEDPQWQQMKTRIVNGPDTLEPSTTTLIATLCELKPSTQTVTPTTIRLIDARGFEKDDDRSWEYTYPTLLEFAIKYKRSNIAMVLLKVGVSVRTGRTLSVEGVVPHRLLSSKALSTDPPCTPSLFREIVQRELDHETTGITSWNRWGLFHCYIDHILPSNPLRPSYHRSEYWSIIWQLWYSYASIHHWPPYLAIDDKGILMSPPFTTQELAASYLNNKNVIHPTRLPRGVQTLALPIVATSPKLGYRQPTTKSIPPSPPPTTPTPTPITITQLDAIIDYVIHSLQYSPSCIEQALMPVTHPFGYSYSTNNNMTISSNIVVTTYTSSSTNTPVIREDNSSQFQLLRLVGSSKLMFDNVITSLQRLFYGVSNTDVSRSWEWSIIPNESPDYLEALHLEALLSSASLMSLIGGSSSLQLPNELPICTKLMRQRKPSRSLRSVRNIARRYPDSYARWLAIHSIPPVEPRSLGMTLFHAIKEPYWYNSLLRYQSSAAMEQLLPHLLICTPLPLDVCRLVCITASFANPSLILLPT